MKHADNGLLFFDEGSGGATFCCNEISILSVNLHNNFDEDNSVAIILVRLLA